MLVTIGGTNKQVMFPSSDTRVETEGWEGALCRTQEGMWW